MHSTAIPNSHLSLCFRIKQSRNFLSQWPPDCLPAASTALLSAASSTWEVQRHCWGGPAVSTCQSTRHLRLLSPVSVHTQGLTTSTQRTEDTSEVQHFSESPSVLANHLQTTIYSSNLHLISVHKQIIVSMKLLIARNYAANISVYISPANCLQQVLFPYSQPEIWAVLLGHTAPIAWLVPCHWGTMLSDPGTNRQRSLAYK